MIEQLFSFRHQGVLFDTENKGIDNRKIEFAWEVFR